MNAETLADLTIKEGLPIVFPVDVDAVMVFPMRSYARAPRGESRFRFDVASLLRIYGADEDLVDKSFVAGAESFQNAIPSTYNKVPYANATIPIYVFPRRTGSLMTFGMVIEAATSGSDGLPVEEICIRAEGHDRDFEEGFRGMGHNIIKMASDKAHYLFPLVQINLELMFKLPNVSDDRDAQAMAYLNSTRALTDQRYLLPRIGPGNL